MCRIFRSCGRGVCALAQHTQKDCGCAFAEQLESLVQSTPETLAASSPGEDSSQALAMGPAIPRTHR